MKFSHPGQGVVGMCARCSEVIFEDENYLRQPSTGALLHTWCAKQLAYVYGAIVPSRHRGNGKGKLPF